MSKRSITLAGHRTSIALEPDYWAVLSRLAAMQGISLAALIGRLDNERDPDTRLASCLRVFALRHRADDD